MDREFIHARVDVILAEFARRRRLNAVMALAIEPRPLRLAATWPRIAELPPKNATIGTDSRAAPVVYASGQVRPTRAEAHRCFESSTRSPRRPTCANTGLTLLTQNQIRSRLKRLSVSREEFSDPECLTPDVDATGCCYGESGQHRKRFHGFKYFFKNS